MKVNSKKLSALAAAGIVGLGMAATPVMADGTGSTDVTYTSGATDAQNGKLLMVVPANINLKVTEKSKTSNLTIRMTDNAEDLPTDLKYAMSLSSQEGLKLVNAGTTAKADYQVSFGSKSSEGQNASLAGLKTAKQDVEAFKVNDITNLDGNGTLQATDYDAKTGSRVLHSFTATITNAESKKLEIKNGIDFKDVMTFKISGVSGTGLGN